MKFSRLRLQLKQSTPAPDSTPTGRPRFSLRQALEDVSKNLGYAKTLLFGSGGEQEAQSDYQLANLAQEMYNANLLQLLITNLAKIDFEVSLDHD